MGEDKSGEEMNLNPPSHQIVKIADEHIEHFQRLIRKSATGVRLAECKAYLRIWESIRLKGGENLEVGERAELRDAITSGDYDHILRPIDGPGRESENPA